MQGDEILHFLGIPELPYFLIFFAVTHKFYTNFTHEQKFPQVRKSARFFARFRFWENFEQIAIFRLPSTEEVKLNYNRSVQLWEQFYPDEPYDYLISMQRNYTTVGSYQTRCGYDVKLAAQRQQNFNYQISLPHYTSPKFLTAALLRYKKYLFLKKLYPKEFLTPCYDFDLIWHTHQVKYLRFNIKFCAENLNFCLEEPMFFRCVSTHKF